MTNQHKAMQAREMALLLTYDWAFSNWQQEIQHFEDIAAECRHKYTESLNINYLTERLNVELSYYNRWHKQANLDDIYTRFQETWSPLDNVEALKHIEKDRWLKKANIAKLLKKINNFAQNNNGVVTLYFDNYTHWLYEQLDDAEKQQYFNRHAKGFSIGGKLDEKSADSPKQIVLLSHGKIGKALPTSALRAHFDKRKQGIERWLKQKAIANLKRARQLTDSDPYYRYGYQLFGPIVLPYIDWMIALQQAGAFEVIYFMSRDGYLFKKMYDERCARLGIVQSSSYLYISRRAVRLLALDEAVTDSFLDNVFDYESIHNNKLSTAFEKLGLDTDNYTELINKYNLESKDMVVDLARDRAKVWALFKEPAISGDLLLQAKKEQANAKAYLQQEKLDAHKKVAIMDFVCRGTIHVRLADFLKTFCDVEVISLNFATTLGAKEKYDEGYKLHGYYATNGVPQQRIDILTSAVPILESIFTAPHPSVAGYRQTEDGVVPTYREDSKVYYNSIKPIQDGVYDYVVNAPTGVEEGCAKPLSRHQSFSILQRLYLQPNEEEAKYLGNLEIDDFSSFTKLASPLPAWHYLVFLKSALAHYRNSAWKRAYLVNLLGRWVTSEKFTKMFGK